MINRLSRAAAAIAWTLAIAGVAFGLGCSKKGETPEGAAPGGANVPANALPGGEERTGQRPSLPGQSR